MIRTCQDCTYDFPSSQSCCPHCARPAHYPNLYEAGTDEERQALEARYANAVEAARSDGSEAVLQAFEAAASASKAVIARSFGDIMRLASGPDQVLSTYHQLIDAGNRLFSDDDAYNRLRTVADPAIFPGYRKDIRFAALSLNEVGLPHYGDYFIVLKDRMIAHRSTVFEENSVDWVVKENWTFADVFYGRAPVAPGYRAGWADRGKITVAKLASKITTATQDSDFAGLLLTPGSGGKDEFMEVHIWGPITVRAIEAVTMRRSHREARELMREADVELLAKAGVEVKVR